MPITVGINHVTIVTIDLDAMVGFYREIFGAEVVFERPATKIEQRMAIVELGADRYLKVVEVSTGDSGLPAPTTTERFGLAIESLSTLRSLRERLVRAGAAVGEIQRLPTQWVLPFADPDGGSLQACAYIRERDGTEPTSQQRVHTRPAEPFH